MYLSKDFIETAEGLVFAVVDHRLEQGRVLCFLRYRKDGQGWNFYWANRLALDVPAKGAEFDIMVETRDAHHAASSIVPAHIRPFVRRVGCSHSNRTRTRSLKSLIATS